MIVKKTSVNTQSIGFSERSHVNPIELEKNIKIDYNINENVIHNEILLNADNRFALSELSDNSNDKNFGNNNKPDDDNNIDKKFKNSNVRKKKLDVKTSLKRLNLVNNISKSQCVNTDMLALERLCMVTKPNVYLGQSQHYLNKYFCQVKLMFENQLTI